MKLAGAVCVVTGGGNGIGAALARRFAAEGAAGVVVADLDATGADAVAASLPDGRASPSPGDVTDETSTSQLVALAEERFGPVDLYCSNAGIGVAAGLDADPRRTGSGCGRSTSSPTCSPPGPCCRRCSSGAGATCSRRRRPPAC